MTVHVSHHAPGAPAAGDEHAGHEGQDHAAVFRRRFWVSLLLSVPVFLYSEPIQDWLGFSAPEFAGDSLVSPLFGVIVFVYGGRVFLEGGVAEARARQPGMMSLITLAISVAFLASVASSVSDVDLDFWWELAALIDVMQHARWWRLLLRRRTRRPGRPRIDHELQALIRQMARENRRWGSMRILGELRSLGFNVSNSTVRRYRGTAADPSRQHWSTFYRNHRPYLVEALHEDAIDGVLLALTAIASRLRLGSSSPERDTKPRTASARADVVIPGGTLAEPDSVVARETASLAHARDGPPARQRAA